MKKIKWMTCLFTCLILIALTFSCAMNSHSVNNNEDETEGEVLSTHKISKSITGFDVAYKLNDWGSGFVADVTITNTSGAVIEDWTLTWDFGGNQKISSAWNSVVTQSGNSVTVKGVDWNANIPAGGSVSFGFQATYRGSNSKPSSFILNGKGSSSSTSSSSSSSSSSSAGGTGIVGQYGQLQVKGTQLCSSSGTPVQLKGMSAFWINWAGDFVNRGAINTLIDDWGSTLYRVSMGIEAENGYLTNPGGMKAKVVEAVDICIEKGVYVIIDWHSHDNLNNKAREIAFFQEMARKYGDKPNVIYEIWNEPTTQDWDTQIKPYSEDIIKAIRAIDPDNIILVGTSTWSQDVDKCADNPIGGNNLMYVLHFYAGTHDDYLKSKAEYALSKGAPIFVSEWGTSHADGGSDGIFHKNASIEWIKWMDQHKFSWANWALFDKDEASCAIRPGGSPNGNWPDSQLTESGLFIKGQIGGGSTTQTNPATPTNPNSDYLIIGRYDDSDQAGPKFAWSATTIKANFSGTDISVNLKSSGDNWFNVIIDGQVKTPINVSASTSNPIKLASGLGWGDHTLELVKRTEGQTGDVQLSGFSVEGGQLLPPPAYSDRRIEFIGDSITCGYGNEGTDKNQSFTTKNENASLAYGTVTAKLLNADQITVAWSGKGMIRNYGGDTTDPLPAVYDRILPFSAYPKWDTGKWDPQVVVINLSTNDYSVGVPERTAFVNAYVNFVKKIRGQYPAAHIYCAIGPMLWGEGLDSARDYISGLVNQFQSAGDTKVHFIEFPGQDGSLGYGEDWHPSAATHAVMAEQLAGQIKKDLNW